MLRCVRLAWACALFATACGGDDSHFDPRDPVDAGPAADGGPPPLDEFIDDFVKDVMPYVEKNYRVLADRSHRADISHYSLHVRSVLHSIEDADHTGALALCP